MRRRSFNGDHPDVAQSLNNMAAALMLLGQYDEARRCYAEALEMRRRLFPGDNDLVAQSLRNLAVALERLDNWAEAEPLHREALDMRQRLFTGDHRAIASSFDSLGRVQHALGRTADAEKMAMKACDMFARISQEDTDEKGVALLNLAAVLIDLRPEDAIVKADQGLAMLQRVFPQGHPYVARGYWRAAGARLATGNAAEALPLIEQCISMAEKLLPADHPELPKYRRTLEECQAAISKGAGP